MTWGTSLAVQWLGPGAFTAVVVGSVPGWGTKILQAAWHGQKKKKKKKRKMTWPFPHMVSSCLNKGRGDPSGGTQMAYLPPWARGG